jgi:hypothetical protein
MVFSLRSATELTISYPEIVVKTKKKLRDLNPRANYTDRATATCRRSYFQLLRIEGFHIVSAAHHLRPQSRFSRPEPLLFFQVAP